MRLLTPIAVLLFTILLSACPEPFAHKIAIKDVEDACEGDAAHAYVRLNGYLQDRGSVTCSDRPGGIHCQFVLAAEKNGGAEVPIIIKAFTASAVSNGINVAVLDHEYPSDLSKPFQVKWNAISIFDRNGKKIDHTDLPIDMLGGIRKDKVTGKCYQEVLKIEMPQ